MRVLRPHLTVLLSLTPVLAIVLLGLTLPSAKLSRAQAPPVPMAGAVNQYYPTYTSNYFGNNSTLYLQNTALTASEVVFTANNPGGGSYSASTSIPERGQVAFRAADFAGLPSSFNGALAVSSSQPSVGVMFYQAISGADRLTVSAGQLANATTLAFGPYFYSSAGTNSLLQFQNVSGSQTQLQFEFFGLDGSAAASYTSPELAPGALFTLQPQAVSGLSAGFQGWVRVSTSAGPIVGVMNNMGSVSRQFITGFDPAAGQATTWLPRALKSVDEGGGSRSTTLFVANPAAAQADVVVSFIASGGQVFSETLSLAGQAARFLDVATLGQLSQGTYSVVVTSSQPVLLWETTDYDGPTTFYANADAYSGEADGSSVYLPGLLDGDSGYSVMSVQNASAATQSVTVTYLSLAGSAVFSEELSLAAGAAQRIDLRNVAALSDNFVGSAVITGSAPVAAMADVLVPPAITPSPTATTPPPTAVPTTPTVPTGVPTATPNPTPPPDRSAPTLYINYDVGAPSSTFLLLGSNYPANAPITITINGTPVGEGIVADASGRFTLLLQTPAAAGDGFYVIVAKTTATAAGVQQVTGGALDLTSYRLASSGPDAVVRVAPPGLTAPQLAVPPSVVAKTQLPLVTLPLVLK